MASETLVERRRVFQQYKEDVKERGKPFFPYAMWHDTIMSFVVVVVIIGLSVVWKYSTPGDHHTTEAGWLGKLYDNPADPGTTNFVPRPDWYFYFLFYCCGSSSGRTPCCSARSASRRSPSCCCSRCPSSTSARSGACRGVPWRSSRRSSSSSRWEC